MKGFFATIYLPISVRAKWRRIKNKSQFVLEMIESLED